MSTRDRHAGYNVVSLLLAISLGILLVGCATSEPVHLSTANVDTTSLSSLQNLSADKLPETDNINQIRLQALQQTALEIGAQGGLAKRSDDINHTLSTQARQLDQTFNFHPMILHHNVLPPVLVEGRTLLNQSASDALRIADHTYKIAKQARFITTPPTWRTYLWMNYKKPAPPDPTLIPKNEQEEAVWRHYVTLGWEKGVEQANTIFNANLARLKQDYAGIILYRKLLALRMISEPYVATTNLGITGDSNHITINDQVLRITALPQLETDSNKWQTAIIDPANDPQRWRLPKGK